MSKHRALPGQTAWGSPWVIGGVLISALALGVGAGSALVARQDGPSSFSAAVARVAGEPVWLLRAPVQVRGLYQWAAANRAILQYIPCFCGCDSVGHRSNYDCYFRHDGNGEQAQFDSHAFG